MKEFSKLNKGKIILTIIIFIVISYLSLQIGIIEESVYCPSYDDNIIVMDACSVIGRLHPLFWLPAPLLTHNHSYSINLGSGWSPLPYFLRGELLLIFPTTIPYWFLLSYILSCFIFVTKNKYILGLSFLISGAIIGCIISYLFIYILGLLFSRLLNISIGGKTPRIVVYLVYTLIGVVLFSIPAISSIRGWKYGYKIEEKKSLKENK